jgi:hypothetical protein
VRANRPPITIPFINEISSNITILPYSRAREAGPSRAALRIPTAGAADFFFT